MTATSSKNRALIKQFPFLETVLEATCYYGDSKKRSVEIKVERADHYLMFGRAFNFGFTDNRCVVSRDSSRSGQIMRQHEFVIAFDSFGEALNVQHWPDREKISEHLFFLKEVFFAESCAIHQKTENLVWVTAKSWHEDKGEECKFPDSRFGDLVDYSVSVTIHRRPKHCGFQELSVEAKLDQHLKLEKVLLEDAKVRIARSGDSAPGSNVYRAGTDIELVEIWGALKELGRIFCLQLKGFQNESLNDSKKSCNGVKIRYSNHLVAIEDLNGCSVSFLMGDDYSFCKRRR
jgi:hypothetical protein